MLLRAPCADIATRTFQLVLGLRHPADEKHRYTHTLIPPTRKKLRCTVVSGCHLSRSQLVAGIGPSGFEKQTSPHSLSFRLNSATNSIPRRYRKGNSGLPKDYRGAQAVPGPRVFYDLERGDVERHARVAAVGADRRG